MTVTMDPVTRRKLSELQDEADSASNAISEINTTLEKVVTGPSSSVSGNLALFADNTGKLLEAVAMSGDVTLTGGAAAVTAIGGKNVSVGAAGTLLTLENAETVSGTKTFTSSPSVSVSSGNAYFTVKSANSEGFYNIYVPNLATGSRWCRVGSRLNAGGFTIQYLNDAGTSITGGVVMDASMNWRPLTANIGTVGSSTYPWAGGYTQTAFTITSGKEFKTNIRDFTDTEKIVAKAIAQKCPRAYQLVSSVAEKGEDKARFHFGAVYEEVYQCFVDAGWTAADIERAALFVSAPAKKLVTKTRAIAATYTITETTTRVVTDRVAVKGADGTYRVETKENTIQEDITCTYPVQDTDGNAVTEVEEYLAEEDDTDATPVRGLRYTELQVWMWVGLIELLDDLAARVTALETPAS